MAIRHKVFTPNTVFKAAEANDLANNGVIQVGTLIDLDSPDMVNANLAYVVDEKSLRMRIAAGVGKDKWSAPFSSRRKSQGVSHPSSGVFQVDNYDPARTYAVSSGTIDGTGRITHPGGVVTLTVSAGPTTVATYTLERTPFTYYTHTWTQPRDCSRPARVYMEWTQVGTEDRVGDPCVNGQCPPGWWCQASGNPAVPARCMTVVPIMRDVEHKTCDGQGTLVGSMCIQECTDTHSEQRKNATPAGWVDDNTGEWWKVVKTL